ncbi:hypothetical protein ACKWTF_015187 [Chironomus riparius]
MKFLVELSFFVHFVNCLANEDEVRKDTIGEVIKNKMEFSEICRKDLEKMFYKKLAPFEVPIKTKSSHKYGNSHDFGDFKNCKNINESQFSTQYCKIQYFNDLIPPISVTPKMSPYQPEWTDLDVSFSLGICLPASCSAEDVKNVVEISFRDEQFKFGSEISCRKGINKKLGWNFERILLISSILIILIILSSLKTKKFKLSTIIKDLIDLNPKNSSTTYFNGLKAIISIIVVLIHCWFFRIFLPFKSGENLRNFQTRFSFLILMSANLFMEIFFIIGGVLAAKGLKNGFETGNKATWIIKFYIKRFTRLFPVLIFLIGLIITSNTENLGPFSSGDEKENCRKFWWGAFAYNFVDPKQKFAQYTWFMSIYFQLALIAPFIFMAINSKKFSKMSTIAVVIGITYLRFIRGSKIYPKLIEMSKDGVTYDHELLFEYTALRLRLFSFFGGMILEKTLNENGIYLLNTLKNHSKACKIITVAIFTILLISSVPHITAILDIIVCLFIMIGINFLFFNNNGSAKKFLSNRFWSPIAKIGLSIYLISGHIQNNLRTYQMEPLEVDSFFQFVMMFFGDVCQSVVPAILTYVFIEEPFARFGEIVAEYL